VLAAGAHVCAASAARICARGHIYAQNISFCRGRRMGWRFRINNTPTAYIAITAKGRRGALPCTTRRL